MKNLKQKIKKWYKDWRYRREYPFVNEAGVRFKITKNGGLRADPYSVIQSDEFKKAQRVAKFIVDNKIVVNGETGLPEKDKNGNFKTWD